MSIDKVIQLHTQGGEADEYFLPDDKRISGNPKQTLWNQYTDESGKFSTGIWHSDIGKWRVAYTEEEYCQILEGTSILADSKGQTQTVTVGDRFTIAKGFIGTWEVVVPTRKIYVIYEASP